MRKILTFILLSFVVISIITIFLGKKFEFSKENIIAIIGFYSIFSSAVLLYLQLKVNLNYNKRKAAIDFAYDKIGKELFPLLKELKKILNKDFLVFTKEMTFKELMNSNQYDDDTKKRTKELVMDILNFYERMSIGVFKNAYDEDICYDDNGFNLIEYYKWAKTYIHELQEKYDQRIFINFQHLAENWQLRLQTQINRMNSLIRKTRKKGTIGNQDI